MHDDSAVGILSAGRRGMFGTKQTVHTAVPGPEHDVRRPIRLVLEAPILLRIPDRGPGGTFILIACGIDFGAEAPGMSGVPSQVLV